MVIKATIKKNKPVDQIGNIKTHMYRVSGFFIWYSSQLIVNINGRGRIHIAFPAADMVKMTC